VAAIGLRFDLGRRRAQRLDEGLRHVVGEREHAKALLAILIAELRVNSLSEIVPTYRVGAPVVARADPGERNGPLIGAWQRLTRRRTRSTVKASLWMASV
jgi:hypothetical protein